MAAWRLRWAILPLLAILAYATVLRIGFLSDDLLLLYTARERGIDPQAWLPDPGWLFYRPVGTFFTWQLGWQLFGFNAFPYHLIGLLLHAATSLLLGLWLSVATSNRTLGWMAGALFAVFPLNTEAVGWLAAQWDALATLFGILSLWLFTLWYSLPVQSPKSKVTYAIRNTLTHHASRITHHASRPFLYAFSLLSFSLGVFTKESLLSFLPIFALSAWLVQEKWTWRDWRKLALALAPFCVPLVANVVLRLATWGNLGGYVGVRGDYAERFWDSLIARAHMLLAPVNGTVVGIAAVQLVGALTSVGLLVGLALYGRRQARLLLVALAWIVLALLPTLDLPIKTADLENNRYLYLAVAGYCTILAALLYETFLLLKLWRLLSLSLVGVLLLLGVAACWANLRPWHTATVQAIELEQELLALIPAPPQPRVEPMVWYVQDAPDNYRGAYIYRQGLGGWRDFTQLDGPLVEKVASAAQANLAAEERDAFALRFIYNERDNWYYVGYGIGITLAGPPPVSSPGQLVWNFEGCGREVLAAWQPVNAQPFCKQGEGLTLSPTNADPQMVAPALQMPAMARGARYLRLRVSVSYPAPPATSTNTDTDAMTSQWFWHGPTTDWSADRTRTLPIERDGKLHLYWTFIPIFEAADLSALRFDTVNGATVATVQWVALDIR